jgi:hypothetical protein
MSDHLPIPAGKAGIAQRALQQQNPLTVPLSPEEMWRQAVQAKRGFESSPSGPVDALRRQPAVIPPGAAGDKGPRVGKGYETFAAVQVVDKDGRRAAFGADSYGSGGLDEHAEAKIVRGLEKNGPGQTRGGRLVVVVEQDCCASCEQRLRAYAAGHGITGIDIHVPSRENLVRPGTLVSPKTAAGTSFQNTGKATFVRRLRSIEMPEALHVEQVHPASSARTAVVGALANLAAGVALGFLQQKMKEEIRESFEKIPQPKPDPRTASVFFGDPNTAKAMRLIDLMAKNLKPFGQELAEHHVKVVAEANMEIALVAVAKLPPQETLNFFEGLLEQVNAYGSDLLVVFDNFEAAKDVASKALESARGAEQLSKLVDRALVADWLLKQGFSLEEIIQIHENLHNYSSRVGQVFRDVDALHAQVRQLLDEQETLAGTLSKLTWQIRMEILVAELKKRGIQP